MGGGSWTVNAYTAHASLKAASGTPTFDWHDTVTRTGVKKAHENLNPFDLKMRESRDSDEHPTSLAIGVLFDVTGSMHTIPQTCQKKLPGLMGLLLRKGYVEHPQILFGAIGDATCDSVPLQVGQFESDNRMDENLEAFYLEGGGGGQKTESYELGMYVMARHTSIDCFEKRGKRGYLFLMGDEMAYPFVKRDEVKVVLGETLQEDIPTATIARELMEKYEVYFILPSGAAHSGDTQVRDFWRALFGQNVIELQDTNTVAEVIASTIGLAEGVADMDEIADHLKDVGTDTRSIATVTTALRDIPVGAAVGRATGGTLSGLAGSPTPRL